MPSLRWTLYVVGFVLLSVGLPINGYAQSAQTITFQMLPDRPLGSSPPTLSATASSGLPVSFSSQTPSVCSVAGTNLSLVAIGACLIRATQEGNAQFLPAPAVTQGFTVFSSTSSAALRGAINLDDSGRTPILVRSGSAQFQVAKFTNNTFQFAPLSDPGSGYRLIGVGDFDGNGRSDLAFQNMNQGIFGDIKIWRDFSPSNEVYWRQVKQVWDVQAAGDMDGDGYSDLVWRYVVSESADTGVSYIWFTNGAGVAQVRKRGGAPLDWQLLGAADLNGDRAADMVYINPSNQVRVLMGTPNRTCANLAATAIPSGYTALKLADFSGKGRADILIKNSAGQVGMLSLNAVGLVLPPYAGTPDDQNAACTSSALTVATESVSLPNVDPSWQYFASGDFNGDGIVDIAWMQPNRTLSVWLMNGAGASPTIINNAGTAPAGFSAFTGEKSGATLPPAPANPLVIVGITPPSVSCTAAPCSQTFSITGTALNNVTSVTLQWNGAKGRGALSWTRGTAEWNSQVSVSGTTALGISIATVGVGEAAGETAWTVFLGTDAGQTASAGFTVTYNPPPPAAALTITGITPASITYSSAPVGQIYTISGTGFNNVNLVTLQWSGARGSGSFSWTLGTTDWNSQVSISSANTMTISPTIIEAGQPAGVTNWTVSLGAPGGLSANTGFSVTYSPIPSPGNFVGTFGLGSAMAGGVERYVVFQLTNAKFGNPIAGSSLTNDTTPFASVAVSSGGGANTSSVIFQVTAGPSGAGVADALKFAMTNVVPVASGATLTYTLHELLPQAMAGVAALASGSVTLESIRVP